MSDFSSLICEIFDGYSQISFGPEILYLRHVGLKDQRNLSLAFEAQKQRAILKHVPTEKEKLDFLEKEGSWGEKDEMEIASKESYIDTLKQTKNKLDLKSQRKSIQDTIDKETSELNSLFFRRKELMGKTAEDFASTHSNEEFIRQLIYRDNELINLRFSSDDFSQMEQEDIYLLTKEYHSVNTRISDDSIQELILSDSFSLYMGQTDKPYDFFAQPISKLTLYQLKILAYGKMFLNIFQNVDDIPDRVRKSPKDLLDFVETKRKRDQKQQKGGKTHSTQSLIGATMEDLEDYDPTAKKIDLGAELKKSGGKMSKDDFAKLFNH